MVFMAVTVQTVIFWDLIQLISVVELPVFRKSREVCVPTYNTWGVQVLRPPNFFLEEWKQIET